MPGSPLGFLTTDLFSLKAKFAVAREPFVPRRRDGVEESIAQFVVRRFNQEFLDHAIDALVAGVYAGDPYKLSVTHAFPKLKALEDNYGSMIKGQIFGARERRKRGEIAKDRAPKFSFDEGLQVLPDALREQLGDSIRLNTSVRQITQTADGWRLSLSEEQSTRVPDPSIADNETDNRDSGKSCFREAVAEHSAVIFCGTAHRLAELKVEIPERKTLTPALSHPMGEGDQKSRAERFLNLSAFSEIRYPPVASVVLGFKREDVAHPACGFGMLIPKIEGFKILGTIFSSALFPNRAPEGCLTLTSYIGGERYPELASLPSEKLYELVLADLRTLLGVRGEPVFKHSAFFPKAIPQYNVGYGRFRELMKKVEADAPGFFLAGHYRDGVSLSDSILSGCNVADRVGEFVQSLGR
jgi:oxygen-dependent protoporphyrinogen oxidase